MSKKNNFIPPKKQQKQDTKKPIFWVLFFLIIFWTVSGILGVCSFIGLSPSSNNALTVKADSVEQDGYIYDGNNFFVPTSSYRGTTPVLGSPYLLSVDILISKNVVSHDKDTFYIRINACMDNRNKYLDNVEHTIGGNWFILDNSLYLSSNRMTQSDRYSDDYYLSFSDGDTSGYTGVYAYISTYYDYDYNNNVVSICYSSTVDDQYVIDGVPVYYVYNKVEYIDNNNNKLSLVFHSCFYQSSVRTGVVAWETRTYYISNVFSDNEFYKNGYLQGYEQGKQDNINNGYQDGYNTGFEAGKNFGYNEGTLDSGNYSFLRLMTAVVDAPIQALTGLFGFELLGVNLMSVISGLFTVCVILVLLRLLLGGGLGG